MFTTKNGTNRHRMCWTGNPIKNGSADKGDEYIALQVIPNFTPQYPFSAGMGVQLEGDESCICTKKQIRFKKTKKTNWTCWSCADKCKKRKRKRKKILYKMGKIWPANPFTALSGWRPAYWGTIVEGSAIIILLNTSVYNLTIIDHIFLSQH